MEHWHARFISLAHLVGTWSKDPSTKVGACIVRPDRTIAGLGYNGFPRGCDDDVEMLADRDVKYMRTVHAEMNAILSARSSVQGCTLYVTPLHPCATCTGAIIQAGIRDVVACLPSDQPARWATSFDQSKRMFREAGVNVTTITQWGKS